MTVTEPTAPTAADFRTCLAEVPRLVQSACGPVEYGDRGQGPPLLSVHGSPGDFVEGLLMAEYFRANGFRVIAPSRPGYGGTPLDTGRTSAEQADALAALLDALGLEQVAVLGASGGGPVGYELAGRHPDRVSCLLQIDSLCQAMPPDRLAYSSRPLLALVLWLADHFPGPVLKIAGGTRDPDPQGEADHVALLRAVVQSVSDRPRMRKGYDNDEAAFASLGELPLDRIACPTMIIHGRADQSVPPGQADHAHAAIRGSQLVWLPDGPHTACFFHPDAQREALSWLRRHTAARPLASPAPIIPGNQGSSAAT